MGGKGSPLQKNKRVQPWKLETNKFRASANTPRNKSSREKVLVGSTSEASEDLSETKFQKASKSPSKPRRAPYFKHFRAERKALKILENTFTNVQNRKTYRANRYLYYRIVPHLAKYLWHPPDRERLRNVEHDLYNQLLSYSYIRGTNREPDRVWIWFFRDPLLQQQHDCGTRSQQQKL